MTKDFQHGVNAQLTSHSDGEAGVLQSHVARKRASNNVLPATCNQEDWASWTLLNDVPTARNAGYELQYLPRTILQSLVQGGAMADAAVSSMPMERNGLQLCLADDLKWRHFENKLTFCQCVWHWKRRRKHRAYRHHWRISNAQHLTLSSIKDISERGQL